MKRLLLGVVVFFVVPLAVAQTEGERVSPLSGRYSFEIPEGWVASTLPVDDNFQGLFPNEALTIAPPQEDFSSEFELIGESDFAGEGIVSVVWPAGLLSSLGLDAAGFGEQLVAANQEGNTVEEVAFSAGEAAGTLYRLEAPEGNSQRILVLADAGGNMLLVVAFAPADRIAEIDTILETLDYAIPDEAAPSVEIDILPETASLLIPPGWWLVAVPDFSLVVSDFTEKTFAAFQNSDFNSVEGVFMLAQERDSALFPPSAYDEHGALRPEVVVGEFDLAGLIGEEPDFEGQIEVSTWENTGGLQGVSLLMTLEDGLRGQIVIVDAEDKLLAVIAVASEEAWARHHETIAAILDTIRLK